ncbi:MAG: pyridoxal-phosphate dependent enzyme, partial [Gemmatimonadota bacterium]
LLSGTYADLTSGVTVTCATDGNHGLAVAWAASRFGARAVIYLAHIVSAARERAIAGLGAETVRSTGHHDQAARECLAAAQRHGWFVISETEKASEPEIALDTLAGYGVLFEEIVAALPPDETPTHVFVQAGVGGLAAACAAGVARRWPERRPKLIVVESDAADCIRRSIEREEPVTVEGPLDTAMVGLAAGVMSGYAWRTLREGADGAIAIPDDSALDTARALGDGRFGDPPIAAGPSGVAGLAAALVTAGAPAMRARLGIDAGSKIVTIGTEGATPE